MNVGTLFALSECSFLYWGMNTVWVQIVTMLSALWCASGYSSPAGMVMYHLESCAAGSWTALTLRHIDHPGGVVRARGRIQREAEARSKSNASLSKCCLRRDARHWALTGPLAPLLISDWDGRQAKQGLWSRLSGQWSIHSCEIIPGLNETTLDRRCAI